MDGFIGLFDFSGDAPIFPEPLTEPYGAHSNFIGRENIVIDPVADHNGVLWKTTASFQCDLKDAPVRFGDTFLCGSHHEIDKLQKPLLLQPLSGSGQLVCDDPDFEFSAQAFKTAAGIGVRNFIFRMPWGQGNAKVLGSFLIPFLFFL